MGKQGSKGTPSEKHGSVTQTPTIHTNTLLFISHFLFLLQPVKVCVVPLQTMQNQEKDGWLMGRWMANV